MAPTRTAPATRRDAVRNRKALTRAAAAAFRDDGLDVAVDAIARRAGVGVATLYRHFPTKLDLILAVTESVLEDLDAAAGRALAAGDRSAVLRDFLRAAMDHQHANRGFLEAITQHALPAGVRDGLSERVVAMLEPVVTAAHAAGTLAPELGGDDLLGAMRMLGAAGSAARPHTPERLLAVVLGGLAAPAPA
jgi:AcrR family transcriptional regulator